MFAPLLLLLPALARATPCYDASGVIVPSVYGASCVFCNLEGYIPAPGTCTCYAPNLTPLCAALPQPSVATVTSACGSGFCADADAKCVVSEWGVLCSECGAEGYINAAAQCQCYNPLGDPNAACALVDDNSYEYSFNSTAVNSTCACYASWALGWFLQDGVCDQCLLPVLGPPPNSALASCLTYGGQDPQQGSAPEFSTCWGHGTWSAANENCTCAPTWRAVDTGMAGIGGKEVLGCLDCAQWWGPPPNDSSLACSVVWTPDPNDGVLKECSGHGTFVGGQCACQGGWALVQLDAVLTCGACQAGLILPLCGGTSPPTAQPSASPSDSPTPIPSASPGLEFPVAFFAPTELAVGALGNRSATSALCRAANPACSAPLAALCYSEGDTVGNFSANYDFPAGGDIFLLAYGPLPGQSIGNLSTVVAGNVYFFAVGFGCAAGGGLYPLEDPNCAGFTSEAGEAYTPDGEFGSCGASPDFVLCLCAQYDGTLAPTGQPTGRPSAAPTHSPASSSPSSAPTSSEPTHSPSRSPTHSPSSSLPSRSPSHAPTYSPSSSHPSHSPTSSTPSKSPTKKPTTSG